MGRAGLALRRRTRQSAGVRLRRQAVLLWRHVTDTVQVSMGLGLVAQSETIHERYTSQLHDDTACKGGRCPKRSRTSKCDFSLGGVEGEDD